MVPDTLLCFGLKTNIGGRGWDMVCSGDEEMVGFFFVDLHKDGLHEEGDGTWFVVGMKKWWFLL